MKIVNLILLALLLLVQYNLWFGHGSLPDNWELERLRAAQREENAQLRERNLALAAEVVDLKEGLEAVEERARSEMGLIVRGETFVQIVERPAAGVEPQP